MVKIIDSLLEEYKNYNDPYKINGSNESFFMLFHHYTYLALKNISSAF